MKSFPTDIKVKALRNDSSSPKNSGLAIATKNVRSRKWGLEGYSPVFEVLPRLVYEGGYLDMTEDWPFPQIWQTDTGIWIGKRNGLYRAVGTTGTWTATRIANVTVGWPWTLANTPMFPVFSSGDCLVYYDYDTTSWIAYTGSNSSGSLWLSTWKPPVAVLSHLGQVIAVGANVATTAPSDSRVVRWSEIGAFRFLGKTAESISNEAGFLYAVVDDNEILLRAMTLGNSIVIYGTFGIFTLRPVTDPVPAFAVDMTRNGIGIANPLAVGGSDKKHLFVARDGTLWLWKSPTDVINRTLPESVGYSEYLAEMQQVVDIPTGRGVVNVVYNEEEDEFYISDGRRSFLFSAEEGLTEIGKYFTSIINLRNAAMTSASNFTYITDRPYGIFTEDGDDSLLWQSDILDQGMNAIKTIESIEVLGTLPEGVVVSVMVESRVNKGTPFRETPWVRCDPAGSCAPIVSGAEMRVNIRMSKYVGATLEEIRIWWKIVDRRYIRGRYDDNISYNRPGGNG